jgi:hypothetical protein
MQPGDIMTNTWKDVEIAHQMFGAKNVVYGVLGTGLGTRDVGESIRW